MSTIAEDLPFDDPDSNPTAALTDDELPGEEIHDSPNAPLGHGQSPNGEDGKGFPERQPISEEVP